jgi:hypothetical protein
MVRQFNAKCINWAFYLQGVIGQPIEYLSLRELDNAMLNVENEQAACRA